MPLRIGHVGPVAQPLSCTAANPIEAEAWLLTEGLVRRGLDVTLFATGNTQTSARLHATFDRGYAENSDMWPWELYEMLNLAAAVDQAADFDLIHYQVAYYPVSLAFARLSPTPIVQTVHHTPSPAEIALWQRYPEALFVATTPPQARLLTGLNVVATIVRGVDGDAFPLREHPDRDGYLVFAGAVSEGTGAAKAVEIAKRARRRLWLAGPGDRDARGAVHVDGVRVRYAVDRDRSARARLFGGARALLYPVHEPDAAMHDLAEAMACGTPVAALERGGVREIVDDGITGIVFPDLESLVEDLPRVFALDRRQVRARALQRFGVEQMVDEHVALYRRLAAR